MGGLPEEVTFKLRREGREGICQIDKGKRVLKSRDITLQQRSTQPKLSLFQESCMDMRVGEDT